MSYHKMPHFLKVGTVALLAWLFVAVSASDSDVCSGWGFSSTMCQMAQDVSANFVDGEPSKPFSIYAPFFYIIDLTDARTTTTDLFGTDREVIVHGYYIVIKGKAGVSAAMRGTNITIVATVTEIETDGDFEVNLSGTDTTKLPPQAPLKPDTADPKPANGPRHSASDRDGEVGENGIEGDVGVEGNVGGNFILATKYLNVASLQAGGYTMTIRTDGGTGGIGGAGGDGGDGQTGIPGVQCGLSATCFGSTCKNSWNRDCPSNLSGSWVTCTKYAPGAGGGGGNAANGGQGGPGGAPGSVHIYSNYAIGVNDNELSNDEAKNLFGHSSESGEGGVGGAPGKPGNGATQPLPCVSQEKGINYVFVNDYEYRTTSYNKVAERGAQGGEAEQGPVGEKPHNALDFSFRATIDAEVKEWEENTNESPQDWVYENAPQPEGYIDYGLQLSQSMLDVMQFNDDDKQNQNAYTLIVLTVSEMLANAQNQANVSSDESEKKRLTALASRAVGILQGANQVTTSSGRPLNEISTINFETLLDDLETQRELGAVLEDYYSHYRLAVDDAELSAALMGNATTNAHTGIQAQYRKQVAIMEDMLALNRSISEVDQAIGGIFLELTAQQELMDDCWVEVQKRAKFQRVMGFVMFGLSVFDIGFSLVKGLSKAGQWEKSETANEAMKYFYRGTQGWSSGKFQTWGQLFIDIEGFFPSAGETPDWSEYEISLEDIMADLYGLPGADPDDLADPLENIYDAEDYDDAVRLSEMMDVVDVNFNRQRIALDKQELNDFISYMKSYCHASAGDFIRTYNKMEMWANQKADLLALYSAYFSFLKEVTAQKLYLQNLVVELQLELQNNMVNPAAPAVKAAHASTYNILLQDFHRSLETVFLAREYLMMGSSSSLDMISLSNCRWETNLFDATSNLYFACSAGAIAELRKSLMRWYEETYTSHQQMEYGSYWGPFEINAQEVGVDVWNEFKETGILNFCVDPSHPAFNVLPDLGGPYFFPLISMDEMYIVYDGVADHVEPVIDITHKGTAGVVRMAEGSTEDELFLMKRFAHANRSSTFMYFGDGPNNDELSMKAWMRSDYIRQKAAFSREKFIDISPFSNYLLEGRRQDIDGITNIRIYFTGSFVKPNTAHTLDATVPLMCTSFDDGSGPPSPTASPEPELALSSDDATPASCEELQISSELREVFVESQGMVLQCEITVEISDSARNLSLALPKEMEISWEWQQKSKHILWDCPNGLMLASSKYEAVFSFGKQTLASSEKAQVNAVDSNSCPENIRIIKVNFKECLY